jgi:hypothetical protein
MCSLGRFILHGLLSWVGVEFAHIRPFHWFLTFPPIRGTRPCKTNWPIVTMLPTPFPIALEVHNEKVCFMEDMTLKFKIIKINHEDFCQSKRGLDYTTCSSVWICKHSCMVFLLMWLHAANGNACGGYNTGSLLWIWQLPPQTQSKQQLYGRRIAKIW